MVIDDMCFMGQTYHTKFWTAYHTYMSTSNGPRGCDDPISLKFEIDRRCVICKAASSNQTVTQTKWRCYLFLATLTTR